MGRPVPLVEGEFFRLEKEEWAVEASFFPELWEALFERIRRETAGEILFAVAIGSRMYNLNEVSSDLDMLVVYQFPASRFLEWGCDTTRGFKSKDNHAPDYTVYELTTFYQLLQAGDTRAVESLYLAAQQGAGGESPVYFISPAFQPLIDSRERFFSALCATKYLSELNGIKGLTKLLSQKEDFEQCCGTLSEQDRTAQSDRINKGLYLLHRLVYQSRLCIHVCSNGTQSTNNFCQGDLESLQIETGGFTCFFESDSRTREFLMKVRRGQSGINFKEHVDYILQEKAQVLEFTKMPVFASPHRIESSWDKQLAQMYLCQLPSGSVKSSETDSFIPSEGKVLDGQLLPMFLMTSSEFELPAILGSWLVVYGPPNRVRGVFLESLPLLYSPASTAKGSVSLISPCCTAYAFQGWIDGLEKGNPNIAQFLLDYHHLE